MRQANVLRCQKQFSSCCNAARPHNATRHKSTIVAAAAETSASSRRQVLQLSVALVGSQLLQDFPASAAPRGSALRKKIPADKYEDLEEGLKYYDIIPGTGAAVEKGTAVVVHYDVLYKGIDVVSSRQARLLGGNRTIAEPFYFVAGKPVNAIQLKDSDNANGLFSGTSGPKPPPALSDAVLGMKLGGIRSVLVNKPELGYVKRMQEIPPGDPFELRVEILEVKKAAE